MVRRKERRLNEKAKEDRPVTKRLRVKRVTRATSRLLRPARKACT